MNKNMTIYNRFHVNCYLKVTFNILVRRLYFRLMEQTSCCQLIAAQILKLELANSASLMVYSAETVSTIYIHKLGLNSKLGQAYLTIMEIIVTRKIILMLLLLPIIKLLTCPNLRTLIEFGYTYSISLFINLLQTEQG